MNLIKSVTLLHQFQREKSEDGSLIATLDDYEVVRKYLTKPIARGLGVELTSGTARLLNDIECNYNPDDEFTTSNLMDVTGLGKIIYDRIKELRKHDYIKIKEPGAGSVATKYCLNPHPKGAVGLELPDLRNELPILSGKEDTNAQILVS